MKLPELFKSGYMPTQVFFFLGAAAVSPCRERNRTSNWKLTRGEVTVRGLRAPPRPARSRWSPDWPAEEGAGPEGLLRPGPDFLLGFGSLGIRAVLRSPLPL